jgi:hypothetical protein
MIVSRYQKYYQEFGEFMHRFANVEALTHELFRQTTTLPDEYARVISAGKRLGEIISLTKNLAKARKLSTQKEMDILFSHLNGISVLRDALVHRGAELVEDKIVSSNARTARIETAPDVLIFNLEDMRRACVDLVQIYVRMILLVNPKLGDGLTDEARRDVHAPWLYKHVQPLRNGADSQNSRPKSPRRPRPSGH